MWQFLIPMLTQMGSQMMGKGGSSGGGGGGGGLGGGLSDMLMGSIHDAMPGLPGSQSHLDGSGHYQQDPAGGGSGGGMGGNLDLSSLFGHMGSNQDQGSNPFLSQMLSMYNQNR